MYKSVSIIIPILNAEKYIKTCLGSIMQLDYPHDKLEIIVVDNGSQDNTLEIVRQYNVSIMIDNRTTVSGLRNLGARSSKGDILAFIDADCITNREWLKNSLPLLNKRGLGAVGCWYRLPERPSLIEKIWDLHMGRRRECSEYAQWVPAGNLIMKKEVFDDIGGFNESLITGEDFDICNRIRNKGYHIYSDQNIAVIHLGNPKNIKEFFLKQYWHGKGGLQMLIREFPVLRFDKTVFFSVTVFLLFLLTIISLFIWLIYGYKALFIYSVIAILAVLFSVSIKGMLRILKCPYALALPLLFLIFAIARALSLFDTETWEKSTKI